MLDRRRRRRLCGAPRKVDGDGAGSAVADIGAFEYQRRPPVASAVAPAPSGTAGDPIAFDGSGSTDPDGDPLDYAWSFDDGTTDAGRTVSHRFATPGTHSATLTVTDPAGLTRRS